MSKCKFIFADGQYCDSNAEVKLLSSEVRVQLRDEHGNRVIRCWRLIEEFSPYCMYHRKLLTGLLEPAIPSSYSKTDLHRMYEARRQVILGWREKR